MGSSWPESRMPIPLLRAMSPATVDTAEPGDSTAHDRNSCIVMVLAHASFT